MKKFFVLLLLVFISACAPGCRSSSKPNTTPTPTQKAGSQNSSNTPNPSEEPEFFISDEEAMQIIETGRFPIAGYYNYYINGEIAVVKMNRDDPNPIILTEKKAFTTVFTDIEFLGVEEMISEYFSEAKIHFTAKVTDPEGIYEYRDRHEMYIFVSLSKNDESEMEILGAYFANGNHEDLLPILLPTVSFDIEFMYDAGLSVKNKNGGETEIIDFTRENIIDVNIFDYARQSDFDFSAKIELTLADGRIIKSNSIRVTYYQYSDSEIANEFSRRFNIANTPWCVEFSDFSNK